MIRERVTNGPFGEVSGDGAETLSRHRLPLHCQFHHCSRVQQTKAKVMAHCKYTLITPLPLFDKLHKWGLAQSLSCDCGQRQAMNHIVDTCPSTQFEGRLNLLHEADDDAVI